MASNLNCIFDNFCLNLLLLLFSFLGPNGKHVCMVFETAGGHRSASVYHVLNAAPQNVWSSFGHPCEGASVRNNSQHHRGQVSSTAHDDALITEVEMIK